MCTHRNELLRAGNTFFVQQKGVRFLVLYIFTFLITECSYLCPYGAFCYKKIQFLFLENVNIFFMK